jgi:RNA polymerase sigma-70 factor (ECF subfamily)
MKDHDCRCLHRRLEEQPAAPAPGAVAAPPTIAEMVEATAAVLRLPRLRALARQLHLSDVDREDVAQETLFKAWRARERYSRAYHLRTWIAGIARNAMLDLYRKQRRRRCGSLTTRDGTTIDPPGPPHDPLDELIDREQAALLAEALRAAPPLVRRIAALRRRGLSFAEVARRLRRTQAGVVSVWHRFKVRTRAAVARGGEG